jgi:hypothetical protein
MVWVSFRRARTGKSGEQSDELLQKIKKGTASHERAVVWVSFRRARTGKKPEARVVTSGLWYWSVSDVSVTGQRKIREIGKL